MYKRLSKKGVCMILLSHGYCRWLPPSAPGLAAEDGAAEADAERAASRARRARRPPGAPAAGAGGRRAPSVVLFSVSSTSWQKKEEFPDLTTEELNPLGQPTRDQYRRRRRRGPRGLPRDPPGGRGYTVSSACAGGARTGRATVTVAETGTVLRTTMCSKIPHGPIPVQSV